MVRFILIILGAPLVLILIPFLPFAIMVYLIYQIFEYKKDSNYYSYRKWKLEQLIKCKENDWDNSDCSFVFGAKKNKQYEEINR